MHRIYCVGRNYVEHAQEMGHTGREPPFFFTKPADAVVCVPEGETGRIDYPSLTKNLHHEIELVVAIGKGGRDIKAGDALGAHLGLRRRPGHDAPRPAERDARSRAGRGASARPSTRRRRSGLCARSSETGELNSGAITLEVNGAAQAEGRPVGADLERERDDRAPVAAWTLQPGDLIFTGTPAGVGAVVQGDVMEGAHRRPAARLKVAVR